MGNQKTNKNISCLKITFGIIENTKNMSSVGNIPKNLFVVLEKNSSKKWISKIKMVMAKRRPFKITQVAKRF